MSDPANTAKGNSWWKAVKAQFHRIIWPTREDIARQSAVALVVSVILGAIIAIFDNVLLQIVDWIITI